MSLRIIAGRFGGRIISTPSGNITHPMSERARNALFNSINDFIINANVLDTFAGSGAIGLEALSRGANHVTFIEHSKQAIKTISHNIAVLKVEDKTTFVKISVENWLQAQNNQYFDLIIADPPYDKLQSNTIQKLFSLLKPGGLLVLSHSNRQETLIESEEVTVIKQHRHATANLTFYRRKG
jgi:16S rRNA (guanine(966)-N(2))-methyltransferase RsmD